MKQARASHFAWLVLALLCGCVRLGYDAHRAPRDPKRDAGHEDAGNKNDAAVSDAAMGLDASGMDASKQDGSMPDGGGMDAGKQDSGGNNPTDGSMQDSGGNDPTDASPQDSGPSDSGPTDSGSDDAATQDAEVDSGPTLPTIWCPERTDAVICDDFESGSLARWEYSVMTSGTFGITTTRAHNSTRSVLATTMTSMTRNSEARRGTKVFDHKTSGDIWSRYWYYVPSSVSVTYGFSTVPIAEIEMPYFGFALELHSTDVQIGVKGTQYGSTPPSTTFPRDQWVCVETHVKIDGSQGIFEAFLNGTLVVTSGMVDTLPDMGYTSIDIGIHYAALGQGPVTAYIDDVIAGYQRYNCN